MSPKAKQIIFVVLAAAVIVFMVWMLKPQTTLAPTTSSVPSVPVSTGPSNSSQQQPVDPALMQRLTELQNQLAQNPKDLKLLTEFGDIMFSLKQYSKSADTYSSILDVEPKNADARVKLGNSLFFQGMTSPAMREYKAALELDPSKAEAHYYIALALSHGNPPDVDSAIKSWQQVVKLSPGTDLATKSQQFIDAYQKQGQ